MCPCLSSSETHRTLSVPHARPVPLRLGGQGGRTPDPRADGGRLFLIAKRPERAWAGRHGNTAVPVFRHAKWGSGCRSSVGADAVSGILLAVLAPSSESGDP